MKFLASTPNLGINNFSLSYIDQNNKGPTDYFIFPFKLHQSKSFLKYAKEMFDNTHFIKFSCKPSMFLLPPIILNKYPNDFKILDILENTKNHELAKVNAISFTGLDLYHLMIFNILYH